MSTLPDELLDYINDFTKDYFTMKFTVETVKSLGVPVAKVNVQIIETNEKEIKELKLENLQNILPTTKMSRPKVGGGRMTLEMVDAEIIKSIKKDLEAKKGEYNVNIESKITTKKQIYNELSKKMEDGFETIMVVTMATKGKIEEAKDYTKKKSNLKF